MAFTAGLSLRCPGIALKQWVTLLGGVLVSLVFSMPARGDLESLVTNDPFFNELERAAARANQAVFNELDPVCANGPNGRCTSDQFEVYLNVAELVHNANELQGSGPTALSLQLDREGLGFALRWTAAEEMAAQGSSSTEFTDGQLTNLASRLTALRFGARGFSLVGHGMMPAEQLAKLDRAMRGEGSGGGAASEGDTQFSRLGGFLNVSYGLGERDPTEREDAFDFDALEFTVGLDYRLNNNIIIGGTFGASLTEVDFDSTRSIVDGGIEGDGLSGAAFLMWNPGSFYISAYGSGQFVNYEMTRFIKYPSFNPDVESTSTATLSETDSTTYTLNLATGYNVSLGAFSVEPYAKLDYLNVTIDQFAERDIANDGFEFVVGEQDIDSFEAAIGLSASFTWTPSFGVFIPYVRGEYHREFEDESRSISAVYRSVADLDGAENFDFLVPTDEEDSDYYSVTGGLSAILRGGRPDSEGVIYGGITVFIEYRTILDLQDITNHVISGGARYEF